MNRILLIACAVILSLSVWVLAQDQTSQTPEEERSFFTSLLEDQLSTDNRIIRIKGISGVLSSQAAIDEITIADRDGIWLRISNATIDWSRTALILRQRLEVSRLAAPSIEILRRPLPDENSIPSPESSSFSVPELPLAVNLGALELDKIAFGPDVFGLESILSLTGNLRLEDGSLDTKLDIKRIDGAGGDFSLAASYQNSNTQLDLDFALSEPADGVLSNMLKIADRPPLALKLAGSGPLNNIDLNLDLKADNKPALQGTAQLRQRSEGIGFDVNLGGPIASLVGAEFRPFFGNDTRLQATGVSRTEGGMLLEILHVTSAALGLEVAAETAPDGFLTTLSMDATISSADNAPVVLPLPNGNTTVKSARLTANLGEAGSNALNAKLSIIDLEAAGFSATDTTLTITGEAKDLQIPTQRSISYQLDGEINNFLPKAKDIDEAIGDRIELIGNGAWQSGQPFAIDQFQLVANGFAARIAGIIQDFSYQGKIELQAKSLEPFSAITGQDLAGAVNFVANGKIEPINGGFDLNLDGTATGLKTGVSAADQLIKGETILSGRIARNERGISADKFQVANPQVTLTANGNIATEASDFRIDTTIENVQALTDRAAGKLTLKARASGKGSDLKFGLNAALPQGRVLDQPLTEAAIGFEGRFADKTLSGTISGDAFIGGERATLSGDILSSEEARRFSNIILNSGGANLAANLTQNKAGILNGKISVDAANISTFAALLLLEAKGALKAEIQVEERENKQFSDISATIQNLKVETLTLNSGAISATVQDLFGVPQVSGNLTAEGLTAANIAVSQISAIAKTVQNETVFTADANLVNQTALSLAGALAAQPQGYRVTLNQAQLKQNEIAARLLNPVELSVTGENISFTPLELDIAGGRITAQGSAGESINLSMALKAIPLSILNTIQPDLAASGTINGTANISGNKDAPKVAFSLNGAAISSALLSDAGVSSLGIQASGTTTGNRLDLQSAITSPEGVSANVAGFVPFDKESMALDIDLQSFPLAVLNRTIKGQNLGGRMTGTARIEGTIADPRANFNIRGNSLSANQLSELGINSLELAADGNFSSGIIGLNNLSVTGPQDLSLNVKGTIPVDQNNVSITADGNFPLGLANRILIDRGTQLAGIALANIQISGNLSNPNLGGTLTVSGATAIDPLTNLRLNSIQLTADLLGETITVRSGSAAFSHGGTMSVSGSVSTNATANFPADLTVQLNDAKYTDGELVTATVSGTMKMVGPLTLDPLLSGNLRLDRAEIIVPENLGGGANAVNVKHINTPQNVTTTLQRARALDGTPMPSARPSVVRLDLNIEAPARIFVRGRGLDAELGGSVRLTGPVTSINPIGGFNLIRGRLAILGQRITFNEGTVSLVGDLDPYLNFVATSETSAITVTINVTGRVSDLQIGFSSQPELPEDEVLSQLIFNRSVNELSPLQLAQLAVAAAELAGGSNSSLLGSLRQATGLDDLDVITDAEGNLGVRAGRYIQENIYLGVETGASGNARATINLDVTKNLKVRGSADTEGDSGVGVFYEKDY